MFGIKTFGAVIGVTGADDFVATMIAGEVFFDFNEVLRHGFDNIIFDARILKV